MTGWEIFSKVDAVKWNRNQAEDISPRVFRLLKGLSIPESNQRGKRNKNHMNPLIQLKKAPPLFVIALVLACFVLSPQAFGQLAVPTFTPANCSVNCQHSINVTISTTSTAANVRIHVVFGQVYTDIANGGSTSVGRLGTLTVCAQARRWRNGRIVERSAWGYSTYTCYCSSNPPYCFQ